MGTFNLILIAFYNFLFLEGRRALTLLLKMLIRKYKY